MNDVLLELKSKVRAKVIQVVDEANLMYGIDLSYPHVIFREMGKTAGYASYHDNTVEFNTILLLDNGQDFIDRTPGHEVAHLVSYKVHGPIHGRGHGSGWKNVMVGLGFNPARCHSYDVSKASPGYTYHCKCQEFHFSKERHNNCRRGRFYKCRSCKTRIEFGPLPVEKSLPAPIAFTTRKVPAATNSNPMDRACKACKALPGQNCKATYSAPGQDPNRSVGMHKSR